MIAYMCPCIIFVTCAKIMVCIYLDTAVLQINILQLVILSLQLSSYHILRYDVCVIVLHLSDDKLYFAIQECHFMLVCLFVWLWFTCF